MTRTRHTAVVLYVVLAIAIVVVHVARISASDPAHHTNLITGVFQCIERLRSTDLNERSEAARSLSYCPLRYLWSTNVLDRATAVSMFGEAAASSGHQNVLAVYRSLSDLSHKREYAKYAIFAMQCFEGTDFAKDIANDLFGSPLFYDEDIFVETISLISHFSSRGRGAPFAGLSDKHFERLVLIADGKDNVVKLDVRYIEPARGLLAQMAKAEHARWRLGRWSSRSN